MSGLTSFAYRPGVTVLHQAPVMVKLVGLAVVMVVVTLVDGVPVDLLGLVGALVGHIVARLPRSGLRRTMVAVGIVALPLAGWTTYVNGWRGGLSVTCDVLAVVILAGVVTGTTSPAALLDALVVPLERLGRWPVLRRWLDAERVALTFSLALAAIPAVSRCAHDAREAAAARGLGRSWRAFLVPTAIRTVAHAFAVADALTARGLGD